MSPVTHFLSGWALAQWPGLDRRGRFVVAGAAILPDLDAAGLVVDLATRNTPGATEYWAAFHHVVGHGLFFAILAFAAGLFFGLPRFKTGLLAFAALHLHIFEDLIGGQGPEGETWPMTYLWPFSDTPQLEWSGQWALNAWPNFVITAALLAFAFFMAWKHSRTPFEGWWPRGDQALVQTLHRRFGQPGAR
jgi:hypothetical protein